AFWILDWGKSDPTGSTMDEAEFKRRTQKTALGVIKLVDELPKGTTTSVIGRQLLRSATSVGANSDPPAAGNPRRMFLQSWPSSRKKLTKGFIGWSFWQRRESCRKAAFVSCSTKSMKLSR